MSIVEAYCAMFFGEYCRGVLFNMFFGEYCRGVLSCSLVSIVEVY